MKYFGLIILGFLFFSVSSLAKTETPLEKSYLKSKSNLAAKIGYAIQNRDTGKIYSAFSKQFGNCMLCASNNYYAFPINNNNGAIQFHLKNGLVTVLISTGSQPSFNYPLTRSNSYGETLYYGPIKCSNPKKIFVQGHYSFNKNSISLNCS